MQTDAENSIDTHTASGPQTRAGPGRGGRDAEPGRPVGWGTRLRRRGGQMHPETGARRGWDSRRVTWAEVNGTDARGIWQPCTQADARARAWMSGRRSKQRAVSRCRRRPRHLLAKTRAGRSHTDLGEADRGVRPHASWAPFWIVPAGSPIEIWVETRETLEMVQASVESGLMGESGGQAWPGAAFSFIPGTCV